MATAWNQMICRLPTAHVLQTEEWAHVKGRYGWQPSRWLWRRSDKAIQLQEWQEDHVPEALPDAGSIAAAALLLIRRPSFTPDWMPPSLAPGIAYVPKGPLMDWADEDLCRRVLKDLQTQAKKRGAVLLKIDPDVELGRGVPGTDDEIENLTGESVYRALKSSGWYFSEDQIQFRNTFLLHLEPSEEALLAAMKQKTRYNIRLARRRGVEIRTGGPADFSLLYRMYRETAKRDGFAIRSQRYYETVWKTFRLHTVAHEPVLISEDPMHAESTPVALMEDAVPRAELLLATVEDEPVAAAVILRFAKRAWFMYGMSRMAHREKMPGYLLQWEAIRRAKAAGCHVYDFWGAPNVFQATDRLWGVYRFKRGFRGQIVRHIGAWDSILRPGWHRLYRLMASAKANFREGF